MTSNVPLLSITVPAYDRAALLDRTLGTPARRTSAPENFEVVVSDDGSTGTTRDFSAAGRPGGDPRRTIAGVATITRTSDLLAPAVTGAVADASSLPAAFAPVTAFAACPLFLASTLAKPVRSLKGGETERAAAGGSFLLTHTGSASRLVSGFAPMPSPYSRRGAQWQLRGR
ncbi:glycosyltransferase [Streptomyces flaveolus]|uniref:glycosyltransferase n=1 Tax=Streptomyces flaveolus TaxID=67297 RepID=UPI0036F9E85D